MRSFAITVIALGFLGLANGKLYYDELCANDQNYWLNYYNLNL